MNIAYENFLEFEVKYINPNLSLKSYDSSLIEALKKAGIVLNPFRLLTQQHRYYDTSNNLLYKNNISLNVDDSSEVPNLRFKYLAGNKNNMGYFREIQIKGAFSDRILSENLFWMAPPLYHIKKRLGWEKIYDLSNIIGFQDGPRPLVTVQAKRRYYSVQFLQPEFDSPTREYDIHFIIDYIESYDHDGFTYSYSEIEVEIFPTSFGWELPFNAVHEALIQLGFRPSYRSKYLTIRDALE